eukprot:308871-Amphidinium_carterae.1
MEGLSPLFDPHDKLVAVLGWQVKAGQNPFISGGSVYEECEVALKRIVDCPVAKRVRRAGLNVIPVLVAARDTHPTPNVSPSVQVIGPAMRT